MQFVTASDYLIKLAHNTQLLNKFVNLIQIKYYFANQPTVALN